MQMDIQVRIGIITSHSFQSRSTKQNPSPPSSSSVYHCSPFKPLCSRRDSEPPPKQNGDSNSDNNTRGDKYSTDWDKAWSSFRKQGKKTFFSQFSPNKYVTWNPRRSNYPLSEEVDPIKKTERSNLMLWTSPTFTLVGAIIVVTFLLIYTILFPLK